MKYDIIGDVHGYATNLKNLLEKMGYQKTDGFYQHPDIDRMAVYVGDYIDRGTEEEAVIDIVRPMIENGSAFGIMGNHEYNAICYATQLENGKYLRKHNDRNYQTHKEFLDEYPFGTDKYNDIIDWFKTLPLFLDFSDFRVIHAAWIQEHIDFIKPKLGDNNTLTNELLLEVSKEGDIYKSLEVLLKGAELILPHNQYWKDPHGLMRNTMRFNWFIEKEDVTYENCALSIPEGVQLPKEVINNPPSLYNSKKPVFFGHYWMSGKPSKQTNKAVCVDYSVAKGGTLTAYHYDGSVISDKNFIY
jgi:hypothetical protein